MSLDGTLYLQILGVPCSTQEAPNAANRTAKLPSLDPECLAVIAYLSYYVPQGQWKLVPSNWSGSDRAACTRNIDNFENLPILRHEQQDRVTLLSGFDRIVEYLSQFKLKPGGSNSSQSKSDEIAFSSHILVHGPPLIDLSLFVSSENYTSVSRPFISSSLPFPLQYTVPPARRKLARTRTAHLGLSALDLDHLDDEDSEEGARKRRQQEMRNPSLLIPARLQRKSAATDNNNTKLLLSAKNRIDNLVDGFCRPLAALLNESRQRNVEALFLLGAQPSPLDCLAVGYLSVMYLPDRLPQSWLRDSLRQHYQPLCQYVDREADKIFKSTTRWMFDSSPAATAETIYSNMSRTVQAISNSILPPPESIPVLNLVLSRPGEASNRATKSTIYKNNATPQESDSTSSLTRDHAQTSQLQPSTMLAGATITAAAVASAALVLSRYDVLPTLQTPSTAGPPQLGEAGKILAAGLDLST